jgi:catechol 2,3-dioxygenase-like lactoylglutathione lyase family enzyme
VIRVTRISHTVFETPDLVRQVEYYSHVIGFHVLSQTSTHAFLGSRVGQEVIGFEAGASNRCRRIAFQVAPGFDHERIATELRPFEIKHEVRSDISPSIARATAFVDLKGTEIELFQDQKEVPIPEAGGGIGPLKLGHIAFSVPSAPCDHKILRRRSWFPCLRLDRGRVCVSPLRSGPSLGQFSYRLSDVHAPYRL